VKPGFWIELSVLHTRARWGGETPHHFKAAKVQLDRLQRVVERRFCVDNAVMFDKRGVISPKAELKWLQTHTRLL
jgi:hypothetical protein